MGLVVVMRFRSVRPRGSIHPECLCSPWEDEDASWPRRPACRAKVREQSGRRADASCGCSACIVRNDGLWRLRHSLTRLNPRPVSIEVELLGFEGDLVVGKHDGGRHLRHTRLSSTGPERRNPAVSGASRIAGEELEPPTRGLWFPSVLALARRSRGWDTKGTTASLAPGA